MKFQLQFDLTNQRFGKYLVIKRAYTWRIGSFWEVKCDCGKFRILNSNDLRKGKCKQCTSCSNRNRIIKKKERKKLPKEYHIWQSMKARCNNKNHAAYKYYGERGIKVCSEWLNSFKNFLDHVGLRPDCKLTLDRINNDGNYEPGNVRWTTRKVQNNNKRKKKRKNG